MTKIAKGFRLVPVEPSEEQIQAGWDAYRDADMPNIVPNCPYYMGTPTKWSVGGAQFDNLEDAKAAQQKMGIRAALLAAMLAAAPVSPLEEAVARVIEAARRLKFNFGFTTIVDADCAEDLIKARRALDAITKEKPDAPKNG